MPLSFQRIVAGATNGVRGAAVAALEPSYLKALCVTGGLSPPHLRQSPPDPARKLRNKVARALEKGGYGSLLIGRPQMMHFYFEIRLQNTSHRLSLHAHKMHGVIFFLASAMCVIMGMLVMDYLVFFR